jgi:hypothetical protein
MRNANAGKLNNVKDIRLYFIIEENGEKKKMKVNRYGEIVEITT